MHQDGGDGGGGGEDAKFTHPQKTLSSNLLFKDIEVKKFGHDSERVSKHLLKDLNNLFRIFSYVREADCFFFLSSFLSVV